MEAITDPANLQLAWTHVRSKNAAGGVDDMSVDTFAQRAEQALEGLREELRAGQYVPDPLREITVRKHDGNGARRTLRLLTVRDKIAQQAVRLVIEPRLDRTFKPVSFGYRPGRGPAAAIARVRELLRAGDAPWVAIADIHDCFPSIVLDRLLARLAAIVQDPDVVHLVELWYRMGAIGSDGEWHDTESGISQGAVLSPLLANLYLDSFDQAMLARKARLVRYADDFLMVAARRDEASAELDAARGYLDGRLGLRLNADSAVYSLADGFTWLGLRFTGRTVAIDPQRLDRASRTLDALVAASHRMPVAEWATAFNRITDGWRRYYGRVLGRDGVAPLDRVALNAAAVLLRAGRGSGRLRSLAEAAAAAQGLSFPIDRSAAERRRLAGAISRGMVPDDGVPLVRPGAAAQPPRRSVAAVVRRRKSQTLASRAPGMHLLISEPGSFLGKQGDALVIRRARKIVLRARLADVRTVSLATHGISLSTDAAITCAQQGVPLLVVGMQNEPVLSITHLGGCDAGLGVMQLRASSHEDSAMPLAHAFVSGKMHNQAALMKYAGKYRARAFEDFACATASYADDVRARLSELKRLPSAGSLEAARARVMGIEGRAAAAYWDLFRRALGDRVPFPGREHHGARDLVNSLLNYGYAILQSRVYLVIRQAGLEPQVSFLHAPQRGIPTLAFDLMEEFRPLVDKVVLALFGRKRRLGIDANGLRTHDTRRLLGSAISRQLVALVPYRGLYQRVEEVMRLQALAIAGHVGGTSHYRPFLMRW